MLGIAYRSNAFRAFWSGLMTSWHDSVESPRLLWRGFLPEGHATLAGWRSIARYRGSSRTPITIETLADDVSAVASLLHLQSFNLVGIRIGGLVAQLIAGRLPERSGP
ncbi:MULTISPECIES: alpha/beta hydrolase [Sinorhizobium]|uniref:alpha/beta fold hydrolase n=1 Tax=Sinorhizobium TaxID=28105 RepID=UPI0011444C61|nr:MULTISPECIES: alpha/beta hydrolase [Sinorhizobium]